MSSMYQRSRQFALPLICMVLVYVFLRTSNVVLLGIIALAFVLLYSTDRRLMHVDHSGEAFGSQTVAGASWSFLCVVALIVLLHDNNEALLLICTVLIYSMVALGLDIQFGLAGVLNFAPGAFMGVGAYTTALLTSRTTFTSANLGIIILSGLLSALIGCILILPVLRTRTHYTALVTIAFGVLFASYMTVNTTVGGPQGSPSGGFRLLGLNMNSISEIGGHAISPYFLYAFLGLVVYVLFHIVVRTIHNSWTGIGLDIGRTDEVTASTFGISLAKNKIFALAVGNFIAGIAGSLFAAVNAYVTPDLFTFQTSLVFISVVILGGMGGLSGILAASFILVVTPEKLQFISQYRLFLYSLLILLVLIFRPNGLFPRPLRVFTDKK